MGNYCVYRYMIGDEWIYVGKAGGTLDQRISAHSKEERFQPFLQECKISYIEFNHKSDMDHAEAALIKIQKPKLNISCKNDDFFPFLLNTDCVEWKEYLTKKEILAKKKEEEVRLNELKKRFAQAKKDEYHYMMEVWRCDEWYENYKEYVKQKAQGEWSKRVIDELNLIYKNGGGEATIIVKKEDDRFVNSLDILRGMSKSWTVDEYDTESVLIHVERDNFIDVVKNIAGWIPLAESFCGMYLSSANELLEKLRVTSVDAALECRKRCTEIYNNALAIIEEAKKYGLEQEE